MEMAKHNAITAHVLDDLRDLRDWARLYRGQLIPAPVLIKKITKILVRHTLGRKHEVGN